MNHRCGMIMAMIFLSATPLLPAAAGEAREAATEQQQVAEPTPRQQAPITLKDRVLNAWHTLTGRTKHQNSELFITAATSPDRDAITKFLNSAHRTSIQQLTTADLNTLSQDRGIPAAAPHLSTQQIVGFLQQPQEGSPLDLGSSKKSLIRSISASQARAVETALKEKNITLPDRDIALKLSARARTLGQQILEKFNPNKAVRRLDIAGAYFPQEPTRDNSASGQSPTGVVQEYHLQPPHPRRLENSVGLVRTMAEARSSDATLAGKQPAAKAAVAAAPSESTPLPQAAAAEVGTDAEAVLQAQRQAVQEAQHAAQRQSLMAEEETARRTQEAQLLALQAKAVQDETDARKRSMTASPSALATATPTPSPKFGTFVQPLIAASGDRAMADAAAGLPEPRMAAEAVEANEPDDDQSSTAAAKELARQALLQKFQEEHAALVKQEQAARSQAEISVQAQFEALRRQMTDEGNALALAQASKVVLTPEEAAAAGIPTGGNTGLVGVATAASARPAVPKLDLSKLPPSPLMPPIVVGDTAEDEVDQPLTPATKNDASASAAATVGDQAAFPPSAAVVRGFPLITASGADAAVPPAQQRPSLFDQFAAQVNEPVATAAAATSTASAAASAPRDMTQPASTSTQRVAQAAGTLARRFRRQ